VRTVELLGPACYTLMGRRLMCAFNRVGLRFVIQIPHMLE